MVGIGGGAPKVPDIDIRLGDVVVSMPGGTGGAVVQYDYGKKTSDGIKRKGTLNNPPQELLTGVAAVRTSHMMKENSLKDFLLAIFQNHPGMKDEFKYQGVENDRLFKTPYKHVGGSTCANCDVKGEIKRSTRNNDNPCIFYGVIASGNLVWEESETRDQLRDEVGALCFEMEAAGLMNNFPCLVIRGICDYADSHENDRWQPYAAATAAAYAKNLLYVIDSSKFKKLSSAARVTGQFDMFVY